MATEAAKILKINEKQEKKSPDNFTTLPFYTFNATKLKHVGYTSLENNGIFVPCFSLFPPYVFNSWKEGNQIPKFDHMVSSFMGLYEMHGNGKSLTEFLNEIDIEELQFYCTHVPVVLGKSEFSYDNSNFQENEMLSKLMAERDYGFQITLDEEIDSTQIYNYSSSLATYKSPYKHVLALISILKGLNYRQLCCRFHKHTEPSVLKSYIEKSISNSVINKLLEMGVLDQSNIHQYLQNAANLLYDEISSNVFKNTFIDELDGAEAVRSFNKKRSQKKFSAENEEISFRYDFIIPGSSVSFDDSFHPLFIPYLVNNIKQIYENIIDMIPEGKRLSLAIVLKSIDEMREYLNSLVKFYQIQQNTTEFKALQELYQYLVKYPIQYANYGTQWLMVKTED